MPKEINTNNVRLWIIRSFDENIQWTIEAKLILLKLVQKWKHKGVKRIFFWKIVRDSLIAKGMPVSNIQNVKAVYGKLKASALREKLLQLKEQQRTDNTTQLPKLYAETIKHLAEIHTNNKNFVSNSDDDTGSAE